MPLCSFLQSLRAAEFQQWVTSGCLRVPAEHLPAFEKDVQGGQLCYPGLKIACQMLHTSSAEGGALQHPAAVWFHSRHQFRL